MLFLNMQEAVTEICVKNISQEQWALDEND